MSSETWGQAPSLRTLIPLGDFKAVLGLDDREDTLSRYCLLSATYTIEQYCLRRLVKKISNEQLAMGKGELVLPLREYPVRKVLSVYIMKNEQLASSNGELPGPVFGLESLVHPDNYFCFPEEGSREDIPFSLAMPKRFTE
jgi:hypothetical protein